MHTVSRYAIQSLGVAFVVLALKSLAYWITGSVALLSDALESIINVAVAGAAYFALRVSETPPDAEHPFGHHKAEYFSAVLEGALIIVAAIAIFREAACIFLSRGSSTRPGLASPSMSSRLRSTPCGAGASFASAAVRDRQRSMPAASTSSPTPCHRPASWLA